MTKNVGKNISGEPVLASMPVSEDFKKISPGLRDGEMIDIAVSILDDLKTEMEKIEALDIGDEEGGLESLLGLQSDAVKDAPQENIDPVEELQEAQEAERDDMRESDEDVAADLAAESAEDISLGDDFIFEDLTNKEEDQTEFYPEESLEEVSEEPEFETSEINVDDIDFPHAVEKMDSEEVLRKARASGMTIIPEENSDADASERDFEALSEILPLQDELEDQTSWDKELIVEKESPAKPVDIKNALSSIKESFPDSMDDEGIPDHISSVIEDIEAEESSALGIEDEMVSEEDDWDIQDITESDPELSTSETSLLEGTSEETVEAASENLWGEDASEEHVETTSENVWHVDTSDDQIDDVKIPEHESLSWNDENITHPHEDEVTEGEMKDTSQEEAQEDLQEEDQDIPTEDENMSEGELDEDFEEDQEPVQEQKKSRKLLYAAMAASAVVIAASSVFIFASPGPQAPQVAPTSLVTPNPASDPQSTAFDGQSEQAALDPADNTFSEVETGSILDLMEDVTSAAPAPSAPPEQGNDPLQQITAGSTLSDESMDLSDLFLGFSEPAAESPAPSAMQEDLPPVVALSDFETVLESIETLDANAQDLFDLVIAQAERLNALEMGLASALERAERAESLAIAQNQVLVRFVSAEEKLEIAEQLIVDLSRRVAMVEGVDAADRDEVDQRLTALDNQFRGLQRDVGMVARMAINGSPSPVVARAPGSANADMATNVILRSPVADPANVPSNVAVGDFVNGFGTVLEIFATSDGGRMVVMENGSIIQN